MPAGTKTVPSAKANGERLAEDGHAIAIVDNGPIMPTCAVAAAPMRSIANASPSTRRGRADVAFRMSQITSGATAAAGRAQQQELGDAQQRRATLVARPVSLQAPDLAAPRRSGPRGHRARRRRAARERAPPGERDLVANASTTPASPAIASRWRRRRGDRSNTDNNSTIDVAGSGTGSTARARRFQCRPDRRSRKLAGGTRSQGRRWPSSRARRLPARRTTMRATRTAAYRKTSGTPIQRHRVDDRHSSERTAVIAPAQEDDQRARRAGPHRKRRRQRATQLRAACRRARRSSAHRPDLAAADQRRLPHRIGRQPARQQRQQVGVARHAGPRHHEVDFGRPMPGFNIPACTYTPTQRTMPTSKHSNSGVDAALFHHVEVLLHFADRVVEDHRRPGPLAVVLDLQVVQAAGVAGRDPAATRRMQASGPLMSCRRRRWSG